MNYTILGKKEIYMQQIFSAIGQAFGKRILIFGLMSLLSLSSLVIFSNQPAFADQPSGRPTEEALIALTPIVKRLGLKKRIDKRLTMKPPRQLQTRKV
jgi:hypothetical protein